MEDRLATNERTFSVIKQAHVWDIRQSRGSSPLHHHPQLSPLVGDDAPNVASGVFVLKHPLSNTLVAPPAMCLVNCASLLLIWRHSA